jgi:hypothetical protein
MRFVARRGKNVTLRTVVEGNADATYPSDTVLTDSDVTIKAVRGTSSRSDRTIRNEAGEDVMADVSFFVADGDEPTIADAGSPPQIIDEDGNTYYVRRIGRKLIDARELLCELAR